MEDVRRSKLLRPLERGEAGLTSDPGWPEPVRRGPTPTATAVISLDGGCWPLRAVERYAIVLCEVEELLSAFPKHISRS